MLMPHSVTPPGSSIHGISQARLLSGLPLPPPGDLPIPGNEPTSLLSPALQVDYLPAKASRKPFEAVTVSLKNHFFKKFIYF